MTGLLTVMIERRCKIPVLIIDAKSDLPNLESDA